MGDMKASKAIVLALFPALLGAGFTGVAAEPEHRIVLELAGSFTFPRQVAGDAGHGGAAPAAFSWNAGGGEFELDYADLLSGYGHSAATFTTRCGGESRWNPGCADVWGPAARQARPAGIAGLSWKRPDKPFHKLKLKLTDIKLNLRNGVSVGVQSYYSTVDKRRFDVGVGGSVGDLKLGVTFTRPGLQLRTDAGGLDLSLRVGAESDNDATVVLGIRNRW